jgi:hypothetical protein
LGGLHGSRVRRIVVKPFLNVFRQFGEINFQDSRFRFEHNAVGFDPADRRVFVFFAVNGFEVLGECEGRGQRRYDCQCGFPVAHPANCAPFALYTATPK